MIYRLTPAEDKKIKFRGITVQPGIGNAVFVDCSEEWVKDFIKSKKINVKEYRDPVPHGFEILKPEK